VEHAQAWWFEKTRLAQDSLGIDEKSLEIRAVEFTTSDVGDAPMLPELLDQIPPGHEIATVTADGAFDMRKYHDAIAARGAAAIIPPRKNAKLWKPDTAGAIARNEILRTSRRVGRTIWRRWSGFHRRSRAETKMHCVKLLGHRLSARDFDCQVAEFQVRVAVLNGFTALGTPITDGRGIGLSGERGGPPLTRFVQQSRSPRKTQFTNFCATDQPFAPCPRAKTSSYRMMSSSPRYATVWTSIRVRTH
jgi:hypothetical protein